MLTVKQNKYLLMTKSSADTGLTITKLFLHYGVQVNINGCNKMVLYELNELPGIFIQFRATLNQSVNYQKVADDFVHCFGGMDVLTNNAGGLKGRCGLNTISDEFDARVMVMNQYAILHLCLFARRSRLNSMVISYRDWNKEFTRDTIHFNRIFGGSIDTQLHVGKSDKILQNTRNRILLGCFGISDNMAPIYLFLVFHTFSEHITGQTIVPNSEQLLSWAY